jgi:DNA-binding transcriptional regulator GbsR (MarR family)
MSNIQNRIIQQDVDPFTMVPNEIIMEPDLSNNAKIVWTYLRMRPHDWTFYNCEILKHIKISSKTLVKTFKELEEFGLIIRTQLRGSNGQFTACNFQIFRTINRQTLDNTESPPVTQKRLSVKPITVNSPLQRKKETKKERTNISQKPNKSSKLNNNLPTLDEIKEECERENYLIDEKKFFKWCLKEGELKSNWRSILMSWANNPLNKCALTQSKTDHPGILLANKKAVIKGSFEFKNNINDFNISEIDFKSLKIDQGEYFYHYDDNFPLKKYKSFLESLKINLTKS